VIFNFLHILNLALFHPSLLIICWMVGNWLTLPKQIELCSDVSLRIARVFVANPVHLSCSVSTRTDTCCSSISSSCSHITSRWKHNMFKWKTLRIDCARGADLTPMPVYIDSNTFICPASPAASARPLLAAGRQSWRPWKARCRAS